MRISTEKKRNILKVHPFFVVVKICNFGLKPEFYWWLLTCLRETALARREDRQEERKTVWNREDV